LIEDSFPLVPATSVFKGYTPPPVSPITAENTSPIAAAPAATPPASAKEAPMVKFSLPPKK